MESRPIDHCESASSLASHSGNGKPAASTAKPPTHWRDGRDPKPPRSSTDPHASLPLSGPAWGDLLAAVSSQLRSLSGAPGQALVLRPSELTEGVWQCANALDRLERSLRHEMGRARRMELSLFDARMALARARMALKGAQDSERDARRRALEDSLTALPNQESFRGRLHLTMGRAAPTGDSLALLYLDLDDFKAVNDSHGHDVGDELLRIVAARLCSALRAGDSVGRLGGDEFACLLANVPGRHELEQVVKKIAQVLSAPVRIGALDLRVQASMGIAVWPGDGDNGDDLLRNADRAMYQAKHQGGGHAFFDRTA